MIQGIGDFAAMAGRQSNRLTRDSSKAVWRTGLAVLFAFVGLVATLALGTITSVGTLDTPSVSAQGDVSGYATSVVSFTPGLHTNNNTLCPPNDQGGTASSLLGPSDDPARDGGIAATFLSTSLGIGGSVTVAFAQPAAGDNDPATEDVWVWETGPAAEHYSVEVSEDGVVFVVVGDSDQATFGSQGFDVDHAGFDDTSRIFYLRVTDLATGAAATCAPPAGLNREGYYVGGSDIDAIGVITAAAFPELELDKTSDYGPDDALVAGDTVNYTFEVTNTGNVDLTDVTVTDPLPGLTAITPPSVATLAPGASATFTASYVITPADVNSGAVSNTASVTGEPTGFCPNCDPPVTTDTEIVPPDQNPALTVDKTSDVADGDILSLGDTVTYTFVAQNTGNVTLTDVTISDPLVGLSPTTPTSVASLAPGESATFTATYQVTQTNIDGGFLTNNATATGEPPDSCTNCPNPVSPPDRVTIEIPPAPGLTIEKTADTTDPVAEGDDITYTFTVVNTGNITLADVTLSDTLAGLVWVNGPNLGSLAPDATAIGTATYTVTAADVTAGGVTNAASVDCVVSCLPVPPTDEVTIPGAAPGLSIVKAADPIGGVVAGDTITYSFTVENTGNVLLEDVTITDALAGLTWVNGPNVGDIAVGASAVGEATYVVTQEDVDAGGVTNSASVDCAVSCVLTPPTSETTVTPDQTPGLSIVKTADTAGPVAAGDVVIYTFAVENTGTTSLSDITITDALPGLTWVSGPNIGALAPGEIGEGSATYTVTADDVAAGGVTNSATVTGTPPIGGGDPPVSPPGEVTIPGAAPGLTIDKSADTAGPVNAGDVITYTFTATNTGNVPLDSVTVADELPGLFWVSGPDLGTIDAGASAVGSATYTVTAADVAAGGVTNAATASGTTPGGSEPIISPPSEITVPGGEVPPPGALTVEKTSDASSGEVHPGDLITYTFVVTNSGGTPVDNVTVSDPLPGLSAIDGPQGSTLAPGESATFTATYPVTEADANAGTVANTATVSGTDAAGVPVSAEDTINLVACTIPGAPEVTPTPGEGTPEPVVDAEVASDVEAAADCPGAEPTSEPQPTKPSGGGGGGPVVQLPSTGQPTSNDTGINPIVPIAALILFGLAMVVSLVQRRRHTGR